MYLWFVVLNLFLIKVCNAATETYPPNTQHVVNSVGYFACDYGSACIQKIKEFHLSQHNKYDCKERYLEIAFPVDNSDKTQTASYGYLTDEKEGCVTKKQAHSKTCVKWRRYPVNATTSLFVIDKECHLIKNTEIDPTIEQYLLDTYRFMTYVAFEADCYNVTANKIDYYCLLQKSQLLGLIYMLIALISFIFIRDVIKDHAEIRNIRKEKTSKKK